MNTTEIGLSGIELEALVAVTYHATEDIHQ